MQEEIIPFFQQVKLSPDSTTVYACYLELAEQVRWRDDKGWF